MSLCCSFEGSEMGDVRAAERADRIRHCSSRRYFVRNSFLRKEVQGNMKRTFLFENDSLLSSSKK
jgi:hypothetical protein